MKRSLLAVLVALSLLVGTTGIAWAAVTSLNLRPGDSVVAKCAGTKLAWSRQNPTQMTLRCQGSSTPSSTPTSPSSTPTSTGGGGTCSPPYVATMTAAHDAYQPDDMHWVQQDEWSSNSPQTMNVCSFSSWNVVTAQANNAGAVRTYPDSELFPEGYTNELNGGTKPLSAYTTITATYDESFPTNGSMDAGFDLWTASGTDLWHAETMVWNEDSGTQTCYNLGNPCAGTSVTIGGVSYDFVNLGDEFIFIKNAQDKAGTVDIKAIYDYEIAHGLASASDRVGNFEYGVEICSTVGTQTFPLNNVTFSLS